MMKIFERTEKYTALFKLTWKHEFPLKEYGKDAFYTKLLDGKL